MSNDKLAALLRECLADYSHPHFTDRGGMADRIRAALQAHAAEAAQAQPQSGEWVMVPREPTDAMDEAGREAGASAYADADGIRIDALWEAMLAAAPQPQAAAVALGAVLEVALSIMDASDPLNAARLRKMRDAAMAKESGR